jgi:peptide deformylase
MAVRPIVLYPDPILRRPCAEVAACGPELAELVRDLADTMYDAPGVGLAAPQIGVDLRVAVVDVDPHGPDSRLHVLVNPRVLSSEGREADFEGCLSIPGFSEKIERPLRVVVGALDAEGRPFELSAGGLFARALCHEIDHLEGVLIVDRLTGLRKELALRRLRRMAAVEARA